MYSKLPLWFRIKYQMQVRRYFMARHPYRDTIITRGMKSKYPHLFWREA